MGNVRFVGLDVHAETIAVAVAEPKGEVRSLGVIPNRAESVGRLIRKLGNPEQLRVCYEAGPTGYVLYWQLSELRVKCEVMAPTLVPVKAGDRVSRSSSLAGSCRRRVRRSGGRGRRVRGIGVSRRRKSHGDELSTQHHDHVNRKDDHVQARPGTSCHDRPGSCCGGSRVGIRSLREEGNQTSRQGGRIQPLQRGVGKRGKQRGQLRRGRLHGHGCEAAGLVPGIKVHTRQRGYHADRHRVAVLPDRGKQEGVELGAESGK